jgi:HSP20 family molecular chaperone IbpA
MKHPFEDLHEGEPIPIETISSGEAVEAELAKAGAAAPKMQELAFDLNDEPEGQLTIDVYQTPQEIVVESAVAGVNPEDLDIHVTTDSVTIRGKRHRESEIKEGDYFYQECYWGRFGRSVILPQEVDPEGAHASLKNGILSVHLPKSKKEKAKKVRVKLE